MAHVREQIRKAIVTALTGLTTTGANVFSSRTLPLGAATPALCIYASSESQDYEGGALDCRPMRIIAVQIQGYHNGAGDDTLDDIAAEVETALYVDPTYGALAQYTNLITQEITRDAEGAAETGVIIILIEVAYRAADGAPTVAL